ncbi:glycosyltransferase family 10 domain-containing protein [Methylotuvimicrobium sp.]|uniref:glycosyltransferase family 10 domain-containing protein n=1 Tax=Methylotuvimicrobium sp. TaxID=2822413 RepID=UPI003D660C3A
MKPSIPQSPIVVKFLTKAEHRMFIRQLPGNSFFWGRCQFNFDPDLQDYDWLVVYDDLPKVGGERFSSCVKKLHCPKQHTLLITTEPSTIKVYGSPYTSQFNYVLTSQEEFALPHRNRIYSQPALIWFYGIGKNSEIPYDRLLSMQPDKSQTISTVCSSKQQKHTLHNQRYRFTQALKERLPELEIFGHGVRDMDDKAVALDAYRYHIAIENFVGDHHWTEKLADAFLGFTLPFYYGCTNVEDYFPKESFFYIDIFDVEKSYRIIKNAIENNEYEKRLPYIIEARRRVLEDYNLFSVLSQHIERHHVLVKSLPHDSMIRSRKAINKQSLLSSVRYFHEKYRVNRYRKRHLKKSS